MIKADDKNVELKGNPIELLQDYVNITREFRKMFTNDVGKDAANEMVALCGRIAFAENKEEEELYMGKLAEVIMKNKDKEQN